MITGFNTDVQHDGCVYHVQTEDRGGENPVLESLVYIGGTIVAKKITPYSEQLQQGATSEMIAALLKRQHQVIIAAIKAGRIEDLIQYSAKTYGQEAASGRAASAQSQKSASQPQTEAPPASQPPVEVITVPESSASPAEPVPAEVPAKPFKAAPRSSFPVGKTGSLNLDDVIADYLRRNSEQARLELQVLAPNVFIAGKNVNVRVQVTRDETPEEDAVVTIKIIGTAFKPQVFIGRAARDGIANFNLALPAFNAGTAAIVIEAQSQRGRGELKQLIRKG
ncbi:MAG TPA: hypothetical protein VNO70_21335 [Blastocatellia bacterium]|nr:hypothetical protein [Blastocatellia bacterium]